MKWMCAWPVRVPVGGGQQRADRPVGGDRVVAGHDRAEPEPALGVRGEQPPAVAARLSVRHLHVVVTMVVRLPHVQHRAGQRRAIRRGHLAGHDARLALPHQVDRVAQVPRRRLDDVEGAQHGGLGRARRAAPVDRLHQHRDAEHIGQQDELLAHVGAFLPGGGEEGDRLFPLRDARLDVPDEAVQVPDQAGEHGAEPLVGRTGEAGDDGVRRPFLSEISGHVLRLNPLADSAAAWSPGSG